MNSKKYTILISGATATGKSSLAIKLAEQLSGEVVNADIGSFYTKLTKGTAKPDWRDESVQHHLFDIVDGPELYSITQFRKRLKPLLEDIWSRGKVPIITGGSTFYIQSFFYEQPAIEGASPFVKSLEKSEASTEMLWQKLNIIDPQRAAAIYQQDRYRIIRALAIFQATGKKPSSFQQTFNPLSSYQFITCDRDRSQLYQRIDERVIQMLDEGWIEEVEKFVGTPWEEFLLKKKMIGYDDILLMLKNKQTKDDVIPVIQKKTRNYAKRQITFLKKLQNELKQEDLPDQMIGQIESGDLTLCYVGLYIRQLVLKILKVFG